MMITSYRKIWAIWSQGCKHSINYILESKENSYCSWNKLQRNNSDFLYDRELKILRNLKIFQKISLLNLNLLFFKTSTYLSQYFLILNKAINLIWYSIFKDNCYNKIRTPKGLWDKVYSSQVDFKIVEKTDELWNELLENIKNSDFIHIFSNENYEIPTLVQKHLDSKNEIKYIKMHKTGSSVSSYKYNIEKVLESLKLVSLEIFYFKLYLIYLFLTFK